EEKRLEEEKRLDQVKRKVELRRLQEKRLNEAKREEHQRGEGKRTEQQAIPGAIEMTQGEENKETEKTQQKKDLFSKIMKQIYTVTPLAYYRKEDKDKDEKEKHHEGKKDSDEMDGRVERSSLEIDNGKGTKRNNFIDEKKNLNIDRREKDGEEVTTAYHNNDVGDDQKREGKHLPNLSCARSYSIFEKMERERKKSFRGKASMNGNKGGSNKLGKRDLTKHAYVNNSVIISHVISRGKDEEEHVPSSHRGDSAGEETDGEASPGEASHGEESHRRVGNHFETRDDSIPRTILNEEKKNELVKMRNQNLQYSNVREGNLRSLLGDVLGEGSVSVPSNEDEFFDVDEEDFFATETEDSFLKIDDEEGEQEEGTMEDIKTHVYRELYGGRRYGRGGRNNLELSSLWGNESPQGDSSPFYSAELRNLSTYDLYRKQISTDEVMWRNSKRLSRKDESVSRSSAEGESKDNISKSSQDAYFDFEKKKFFNREEKYKMSANSISGLSSDDSIVARRKMYYLDSLRIHYDEGSDPFTNYSFEKIDTRNYPREGKYAPDEHHSGSDDEILATVMDNLNGSNNKIKSIGLSYHIENGRGNMSGGVAEYLHRRRSGMVPHVDRLHLDPLHADGLHAESLHANSLDADGDYTGGYHAGAHYTGEHYTPGNYTRGHYTRGHYTRDNYTSGNCTDPHHDDLSSSSLYHSKTQSHINATRNFQRVYSRQ
ncbi:hypothetical protein C922_04477, partial [Plasmodium inui San Antonio 1]